MIGGLMQESLLQINYSPISNFCLMRLCHYVFSLFLRDTLHEIYLVLFFTFTLLLFSEAPYPLAADSFAGTRTRQQVVYQINWTYLTNPGIIMPNFYTNIS
jgi:hypothetical protein